MMDRGQSSSKKKKESKKEMTISSYREEQVEWFEPQLAKEMTCPSLRYRKTCLTI